MTEYKSLELQSHVTIDDVLNKVNQEVWELLEAYQQNDVQDMHKEACDVAINILSVATNLWINISEIENTTKGWDIDMLSLAIQQGIWNQQVQAMRWKYSRDNADPIELQQSTQQLLSDILQCTHLNLWEIIQNNTAKFKSRQWKYIDTIDLKNHITDHIDFPKQGISFKDISPILQSPDLLRYTCMELAKNCSESDVIVWLDARWFLFWNLVAQYLSKPFVMARKAWKIPGETIQKSYGLEYGEDILEMQVDSIAPWQKVSIIDDLLATGGTVGAAIDLVEQLHWEVNNISFVISLNEPDLVNLASRKRFDNYNVNSIVSYN